MGQLCVCPVYFLDPWDRFPSPRDPEGEEATVEKEAERLIPVKWFWKAGACRTSCPHQPVLHILLYLIITSRAEIGSHTYKNYVSLTVMNLCSVFTGCFYNLYSPLNQPFRLNLSCSPKQCFNTLTVHKANGYWTQVKQEAILNTETYRKPVWISTSWRRWRGVLSILKHTVYDIYVGEWSVLRHILRSDCVSDCVSEANVLKGTDRAHGPK